MDSLICLQTTLPTSKDGKKLNRIWRRDKDMEKTSQNEETSSLAPAVALIDEVHKWLTESESSLDDDVINLKSSDLQALIEKRKQLEDLYNEIESYTSKIYPISELIQTFCQMIPPSEQRDEKKRMISEARTRMVKLRLKVAEQREKFGLIVPLVCHFNEQSTKVKPWLDEAEIKSQPFIDKYNDDIALLENADYIETLLIELLEMRPVYEAYLTYGETALDTAIIPFEDLRTDLEDVISRWDSLCMKLEKCLNGLGIAKKHEEENQKTEATKIESQLRREAYKCNCHKPFQIVRIGEGKYTFGDSKIVRLVRIHGSSIVVRVGGGWEFLLNFLMKYDPCRAKDLLEDGIENFRKFGMKPVDERRHSFAFESRKVYGTGCHVWSKEHSNSHKDVSNNCQEVAEIDKNSLCSSIDSLDGASLGSDAGHTCNEKSTRRRRTPIKNTPKRKVSSSKLQQTPETPCSSSPSVIMRPKSATPGSATRPTRRSLVERQTEFSDMMKSAGLHRTSSPRAMKVHGI